MDNPDITDNCPIIEQYNGYQSSGVCMNPSSDDKLENTRGKTQDVSQETIVVKITN